MNTRRRRKTRRRMTDENEKTEKGAAVSGWVYQLDDIWALGERDEGGQAHAFTRVVHIM